MWGISRLAEELLASQEELCSMQLVRSLLSKCSLNTALAGTIHTRTHHHLSVWLPHTPDIHLQFTVPTVNAINTGTSCQIQHGALNCQGISMFCIYFSS
jgi:hypothetical protein